MTDLQETLAILSTPWADNLESRDGAVPGSVILRVLSTHTHGGTVRATEHNRARNVSTRHVVCLSGGVDNLVNSLHSEVHGHELATVNQFSIEDDEQ